MNMELAQTPIDGHPALQTIQKRVIFSQGSKGGTGKTSTIVPLVEWYANKGIGCSLLDLDVENKSMGSLQHYFPQARKANIATPSGLDIVTDELMNSEHDVLLADMGSGSGDATHSWFDVMHEDILSLGIAFTAIGLVTDDPATVRSILSWAMRLQNRVQYLIVENSISPQSEFLYWREAEQAERFRQQFKPTILRAEFRLSELEAGSREHGVTLGQIATRSHAIPELSRSSLRLRAQGYRRRLFEQFDRAEALLLP